MFKRGKEKGKKAAIIIMMMIIIIILCIDSFITRDLFNFIVWVTLVYDKYCMLGKIYG
jgi:hypothetical protein